MVMDVLRYQILCVYLPLKIQIIVMEIKRNEAVEPQWHEMIYAERSKHGVFSSEGWNKTVEWKVLLEHAKKTQGICHLIFEYTYPSSLFFASVELLEANIYVFGDLFYWLTGLNANTLDNGLIDEALSRIWFWNMRCYKDLRQIQHELEEIESLLIEGLKQGPLWDDLKTSPIWKSDNTLSHFRPRLDDPISWDEGKRWARHYAFTYIQERYKVTETDNADFTQRIVNILQRTQFFMLLLGACGACFNYNFSPSLSLFRKSEKARSRYIKPWERYFSGSRDSLIEKMRSNPDLGPWVDRYICLEGDEYIMGRLFFEELSDNVFFPIKKETEDEFYNPVVWISLMTIATVLQEYDEQHDTSTPAATTGDKVEDEILLTKLSMFFKDEVVTRKFLDAARTMDNRRIIGLVKHYKKYGNCSNTSKALWEVLHEAGIYTAGYSNWSAQI